MADENDLNDGIEAAIKGVEARKLYRNLQYATSQQEYALYGILLYANEKSKLATGLYETHAINLTHQGLHWLNKNKSYQAGLMKPIRDRAAIDSNLKISRDFKIIEDFVIAHAPPNGSQASIR